VFFLWGYRQVFIEEYAPAFFANSEFSVFLVEVKNIPYGTAVVTICMVHITGSTPQAM
jgi:hypothetical protein